MTIPTEPDTTGEAKPAPPAPVDTEAQAAVGSDDWPHEPTIAISPPAISGWSGRTFVEKPLVVAPPAPTPHPNDSDLTKWNQEEVVGGEGGDSMALDMEGQEYTVGELVDYLETVTDEARLDELQAMEEGREGGPRANALRAIQDRREELAGQPSS